MIDVVFVIMLFFMVMTGTLKIERELGLQLPGPPGLGMDVRFPDNEVSIGIEEDGTVTMNDEIFDSPRDKALPALTQTLRRLTLSSERQGDKVLATIHAEDQASYERIIDVLGSLERAKVTHVTFAVGSPF